MKLNLLREKRIQRGWSQAKLAKALGVDARTVRRWELGQALPVPHYRQKLSGLFGQTAEELGLSPDSEENEALEHESEVPAAQQLVVSPEIEGVQAHPERLRVSEDHPSSSRFFWDVNLRMRLVLPSQLFNPFSSRRRLELIGSTILLVVLGLAAVLPAFHWQTSPRTRTQNHFGSASAATTFQNIYTQATSGTPVINDALSAQSDTSWAIYHTESGGCAFTAGALHCISTESGYDTSYAQLNNFSNLADLAIEVSTTIIQGDLADVFLRWHDSTESGYRLYFTSNGRYTFEFLDKDDEHVLISQSSSAIHTGTGQSNTITIIARGNTFYLYINKTYVNSVSDRTFRSGQIALGSDDRNIASEVAFSNVRIWQL